MSSFHLEVTSISHLSKCKKLNNIPKPLTQNSNMLTNPKTWFNHLLSGLLQHNTLRMDKEIYSLKTSCI